MVSHKFPHNNQTKEGFRVTRTPFFLVKRRLNALKKSRIAVVISKASMRSSVQRNFWKRQAKNNLLKLMKEPSDVFIVLNNKMNDITKKQFINEIKKIF